MNTSLRDDHLPPGPAVPQALQALAWSLRPLGLMEKCRERYGDVFTLRVRHGQPWVLLSNPEDIRVVLTLSPELVSAGAAEANPLLGPLLGERSVMLRNEPEHMAQRKLLLPAFHGARMAAYGEMITEVAQREIAGWPVGEPFAMWPRMQAISNEVVMRATFGDTSGPLMEQLRVRLRSMTDWLNKSSRLAVLAALGSRWLSHSSGFSATLKPVEETLFSIVRERRARGVRDDRSILGMLEDAHDAAGHGISDEELRDELITLLSDGPTATSLAWTFEQLLSHPEELARVREEALAGDGDEYATAVVKEILRLCPTVPIVMRRIARPITLSSGQVPANSIVAPCMHLVHHRPDIYSDPHRFQPARFLGRQPEEYTWLPFGSGVRRCIAAQFAQLEMRRVIHAVFREVELVAVPAKDGRARRSSVSFAPADRAPVMVTRALSTDGRVFAVS